MNKEGKFSVVLKGFNTKREAEEFVAWYGEQGEQDIDIWLDCRRDEGKIKTEYMSQDMSIKPKWSGDQYEATLKMSYPDGAN